MEQPNNWGQQSPLWSRLAVWLSGNALVVPYRAQLVPGEITVL